jgi:hypothetical protein
MVVSGIRFILLRRDIAVLGSIIRDWDSIVTHPAPEIAHEHVPINKTPAKVR